MIEYSNQVLAVVGSTTASATVAVAAILSNSTTRVRIHLLSLVFVIGSIFELLAYFGQYGLPTTNTFFSHLVIGSSGILWILTLSAASIAARQLRTFSSLSNDAKMIMIIVSSVSQAAVDIEILKATLWSFITISTLLIALVISTNTGTNVVSACKDLSSNLRSKVPSLRLAALVIGFASIFLPIVLLSTHSATSFHNASPSSQIFPFETQGHQGHSSNNAFSSGVLPNGSDGESHLPMVVKFFGTVSASNPNVKQVVRVWVKGVLDHGRIGNLALVATGVPQPSGFLNLVNSRAIVSLKADHLVGRGKITLVNARAVRGLVKFPRIGGYDFILTTIPNSYNHVEGSLTLIKSRNTDNDSVSGGANLA